MADKKIRGNFPASEGMAQVDTIADLKALVETDVDSVTVLGYFAPGDIDTRIALFDATSTTNDNGGTVIIPTYSGFGGVGRWLFTEDEVNVKHFGAKGDGTTDDTAILNSLFKSDTVMFFPSGEYKISSAIGGDSLTNFTMYANSWNAKIISSIAGDVIIFTNSSSIAVRGLFVQGVKTLVNAAGCINFDNTDNFEATGNFVTSSSRMGIRATGNVSKSSFGIIANNHVTESFQDGIMVRNDSENITIEGNVCWQNGEPTFNPPLGEGIHMFATRKVVVDGNICYGNSNNGISFEGCEDSIATSNICSNNVQSGISVGEEATVRGDRVIVDGNICKDNGVDGIIIADVSDLIISNNQCHDNNNWGIGQGILTGPDIQERIIIDGNNCSGNTLGAINQAFVNADSKITNNILRGPLGWGILISNNTTTNTYIAGNNIKDFATDLISDLGVDTIIQNNQGYVTESRGSDVIPSGSTSVVITHGLSRTPTREDIVITPGNNTTADIRNVWVATFTSTTFNVNVAVDPGASGFSFGWRTI